MHKWCISCPEITPFFSGVHWVAALSVCSITLPSCSQSAHQTRCMERLTVCSQAKSSGEKKTKSRQTLKTTLRNKQRALTTLMGRGTYSPLNAAGFPFHDLLAGLPMAAASWLSYGCAWLSHFPPNSLAVIAANERATILAWTVMGRCQGGTPVICCMCLCVCMDLHFRLSAPSCSPFLSPTYSAQINMHACVCVLQAEGNNGDFTAVDRTN